MLTVWRLVTARFAKSAFSGEGARLYGGRWNRKGVPLVYTAGTQSLAMLEMLVQDEPLRARYVVIEARIPKGVGEETKRRSVRRSERGDSRRDQLSAQSAACGFSANQDRQASKIRNRSPLDQNVSDCAVGLRVCFSSSRRG